MIGLLDPALFLQRPEQDVLRDLDVVLRICTKFSISVPALDEYWPDLWSRLGSPLERALSPEGRRTLQELRRLEQRSKMVIPALTPGAGLVWRRGFQQLFSPQHFADSWEERMAAAAVRAAHTGQKVVLLTRRVLGRNLVRHASGGTTLDENTRWVLHLQPTGIGHIQVMCVYHARNLADHWTTRFDWRLPGQEGARYPFCPPNGWWKGSVVAWKTVSSKPAWVDRHGNGWARPNIPNGAGYHWDVFIQSGALKQAVGLDQINVVEFGAPATEGQPGQIHHIPAAKAGKITQVGWSC